MRIKIQGGTPGGDVLCRSCGHAQILNRDMSSERILCTAVNPYGARVKEPVYVCTEWGQKDLVGLKRMEEMAWLISTSRPKRVGFAPGSAPLEVVVKAPKEKDREDD